MLLSVRAPWCWISVASPLVQGIQLLFLLVLQILMNQIIHVGKKIFTDHANKVGHPGFKTKRSRQQKFKTGVSVAPQKGLVSSKTFQKK